MPTGSHSHDEALEAKAHPIGPLSVQALEAYEPGRLVRCCDAKTGRQVRERTAPTKPARPGQGERRAHEDMRHGTRVRIHALVVATGQRAWPLGRPRTATDVVAHLHHVSQRLPRRQQEAWGLDNLNTPWSLAVCRVGARWCHGPCEPPKLKTGPQRRAFVSDPNHRHGLHGTPKHGSWLTQAAFFFGGVQRRLLARGSCPNRKNFARR